jgi:hypothetical protein
MAARHCSTTWNLARSHPENLSSSMHWSPAPGFVLPKPASQILAMCLQTGAPRPSEASPTPRRREGPKAGVGGAKSAAFRSLPGRTTARPVSGEQNHDPGCAHLIRLRCIPKMDHHCPWTGNCVSYHTFPHFMRYLVYAVASISYLEYFLCGRVAVVWNGRNLPSVRIEEFAPGWLVAEAFNST